MAHISTVLLCLSLIIVFEQCQSPSDEIKKEFEKVDKSLENSNDLLGNSIDGIYSAIDGARNKNEQLALKADTIYFVTKQTSHYMDSLSKAMQLLDTSGTNLNVSTEVLVVGPSGENLKRRLLSFYEDVNSYSIAGIKREDLDKILQSFREIKINKDWTKTYFLNTPTVAAITILNKYQYDCTNAATIILMDIKDRLAQ